MIEYYMITYAVKTVYNTRTSHYSTNMNSLIRSIPGLHKNTFEKLKSISVG